MNTREAVAKYAEEQCAGRVNRLFRERKWRELKLAVEAFKCAEARRVLVEAEEAERDRSALVVEGVAA